MRRRALRKMRFGWAISAAVLSLHGLIRNASACPPPPTWDRKVASPLYQAWQAPQGSIASRRVEVFIATASCDDACRQSLRRAGFRGRSRIDVAPRDNGATTIFTGSLRLRDLPNVAHVAPVVMIEGSPRVMPKTPRPRVHK